MTFTTNSIYWTSQDTKASVIVRYDGQSSQDDRPKFSWTLTTCDAEGITTVMSTDVTAIYGGAGSTPSAIRGMDALLSFFTAWEEARSYGDIDSFGYDMFPEDATPFRRNYLEELYAEWYAHFGSTDHGELHEDFL